MSTEESAARRRSGVSRYRACIIPISVEKASASGSNPHGLWRFLAVRPSKAADDPPQPRFRRAPKTNLSLLKTLYKTS